MLTQQGGLRQNYDGNWLTFTMQQNGKAVVMSAYYKKGRRGCELESIHLMQAGKDGVASKFLFVLERHGGKVAVGAKIGQTTTFSESLHTEDFRRLGIDAAELWSRLAKKEIYVWNELRKKSKAD